MFDPIQAASSLPSLTTEYIGNKRNLLGFITQAIMEGSGNGKREIVDLFSGTGVVSAAFKTLGYVVTANDHLATCFNLTSAVLLNNTQPAFEGLSNVLTGTFQNDNAYQVVLDHLNNLEAKPFGFIHRNYSPASVAEVGIERRYFSEMNAKRIDTIRDTIEVWRPMLTDAEHALLISDLVRATSAVSNVAGTYGCYLKRWKARALAPLVLRPNCFIDGCQKGHVVWSMEASEAICKSKARIIYADPPYTKRQYAAYYHVLETIVLNDQPLLVGSTGLRDWEIQSSDFCYTRRAIGALEWLLQSMDCEHFFLSYNEDGQMEHNLILEVLSTFGRTSFREMPLRRYRSSTRPHKGPFVVERIYHLAVG